MTSAVAVDDGAGDTDGATAAADNDTEVMLAILFVVLII
jgi:hypothetical protein